MSTQQQPTGILKLANVRLSYPHLFEKHGQDGNKPKYSASFILHKVANDAGIKSIRATFEKLFTEKGIKTKGAYKPCLRDGVEKEGKAGYDADVMFFNASSDRRPEVFDNNTSPLTEDTGRLYAGCYVNCLVKFWIQDNKFGKRVNAELLKVQYLREGEHLGGDHGVEKGSDGVFTDESGGTEDGIL